MDLKTFIAIISVIMTFVGISFYIRDIFAGKTKPHTYSWLIWTTLTAVAFVGQIVGGAGPGAWATGASSVLSMLILILSLSHGEKDITKSDKFFLGASVLAIIPWLITSDPLLSIVLVTLIDAMGFLPTLRKSIKRPYEETLIHYVFAGLKSALSLMAITNYSIVTALYPLVLVTGNWLVAIVLITGRKIISDKAY